MPYPIRPFPPTSGDILTIAIILYAIAIIIANSLAAKFGPSITPYTAFAFIGLDLTIKDYLQVRLTKWQMASVIVGAGILAFAIDSSARFIAVASLIAFVVSSFADYITFRLTSGKWLKRSMYSNAVGAAVDSIVFPTVAFGGLMPMIVAGQFVAKVAGASLFAVLVSKFFNDKS